MDKADYMEKGLTVDASEKYALVQRRRLVSSTSQRSNARVVRLHIEFLTIGEVDTMNEKFQAEVKIRASWYHDEHIDKYDKSMHWNPKLFIENGIGEVKEEISYHVSQEAGDSIVTETRISKGSFWERIELQDFPVDMQQLSITVASRRKLYQVKLEADTDRVCNIHPEALNTFRDQQKWKLYNFVEVSQSASYDKGSATSLSSTLSGNNSITSRDEEKKAKEEFATSDESKSRCKQPKLVASIFCSRKPGFYLMNCYSFIFLITVLSLTQFAIDIHVAQNRIGGTFTLILTSVSFKSNTTNKNIPTISYMTSLDRYQIINIIYLCMCCVWHSSISSSAIAISTKYIMDKVALGIFAAIFLSIQIFFTINFLIANKKTKKLKEKESKFFARYGKYVEIDDVDDE